MDLDPVFPRKFRSGFRGSEFHCLQIIIRNLLRFLYKFFKTRVVDQHHAVADLDVEPDSMYHPDPESDFYLMRIRIFI
jgi:hypothetical protein